MNLSPRLFRKFCLDAKNYPQKKISFEGNILRISI